MKIKIPFNEWSEAKLDEQKKKATSRYKKYGEVGDTFVVNNYTYELELVIKVPLWFVAEDLYRSEDAESTVEFHKIWIDIHPLKGFRPFDEIWYHHFKEINRSKKESN